MFPQKTMHKFKRTELGEQELLHRKLRLSARTRTLLLLLESEDLKQLSKDAFEKIANPENYKILLDLMLIVDDSSSENMLPVAGNTIIQIEERSETVQPISQPAIVETSFITEASSHITSTVESESPAELEPALSFVEIKDLMQQTLKQYCGLMAKNLITAIANAKSISEIRQHQSKWLTSLFETRIPRQQLNILLQQINQSMEEIEVSG